MDKFLVHSGEEDSQPASLLAIGGLFNLICSLVLGGWMIMSGQNIGFDTLLPLIANGAIYVASVWIYLSVLREEDSSRVVPWFQTIPIFGVLGGFFVLGEKLHWYELFAISFLVFGGLILSVKNGVVKKKLATLMILSSGLIALHDVIFADFGRQISATPAIFADMFGKALFGLILLVGKKERKGFVIGLRTKFSYQSVGEIVCIIADVLVDLAKLYVPIAIVQAMCCSQPLFVLIGAIFLTKYYPQIVSEELGGTIWRKLGGITLMIVGGVILAVI